jgi:hypothetical protein
MWLLRCFPRTPIPILTGVCQHMLILILATFANTVLKDLIKRWALEYSAYPTLRLPDSALNFFRCPYVFANACRIGGQKHRHFLQLWLCANWCLPTHADSDLSQVCKHGIKRSNKKAGPGILCLSHTQIARFSPQLVLGPVGVCQRMPNRGAKTQAFFPTLALYFSISIEVDLIYVCKHGNKMSAKKTGL